MKYSWHISHSYNHLLTFDNLGGSLSSGISETCTAFIIRRESFVGERDHAFLTAPLTTATISFSLGLPVSLQMFFSCLDSCSCFFLISACLVIFNLQTTKRISYVVNLIIFPTEPEKLSAIL